MRILVTRALEDGEEIAARLRERGHEALLAPVLTPRFCQRPPPNFDDVQAILATSANGIRALLRHTERRDFSIFAVGPQSAAQARKAGFTDVRSADGDAIALADAVSRWAAPGAVLLHVCGQDAAGTLAENLALQGFKVRRATLYGIEPAQDLPEDAKSALLEKTLDGALFFSPRSARIFLALARGLPIDRLSAFCISAATAQALAPIAFARIAVAERPNQPALLALLG